MRHKARHRSLWSATLFHSLLVAVGFAATTPATESDYVELCDEVSEALLEKTG